MSLSGSIAEIGLAEVVGLIASAERSGLLRVRDGAMEGQVYLEEGRVTYATSRAEDSLLSDLIRFGLVEEDDRIRVERRKANIEDVLRSEAGREKLAEFLEEQIIEVLVRLMRLPKGTFEFQDEVRARYSTGHSFPAQSLLEEAASRLTKWREIEEVIPSPTQLLRMMPELEGRTGVEVDRLSWSLLAALGTGSSVQEVTRRLGRWEYPTARILAKLVREGLVELVEEASSPTEVPAERPAQPEPPQEEPEAPEAEAPSPETLPEGEEGSDLMRRWKQLRTREDRSTG